MNPNHTFYIDKRLSSISLDGEWRFTFPDNASEEPWQLDYPHTAKLPASGYRCLEQAGILPDPYFGCQSKLYEWADRKLWYFTRSFLLEDTHGKDVFLCFDGVGYACRVWLNRRLICSHEGMFGGPILEVGDYVHAGENTLYVEVIPPAPDYRRFVQKRQTGGDDRAEREIVPWDIRRDAECSNGDFTVFGIWRSVRLEIVPKTHISRPYLYTEAIGEQRATLRLSVEIADPQVKELEVVPNDTGAWSWYTFAYQNGMDIRPTGRQVRVCVTITERDTGCLAYTSDDKVELWDKRAVCPNDAFRECQFFEKTIEIEHPHLWWPNQLGEPSLYTVTLALYEDEALLDVLSFDTGIRTVDYIPSAGARHRTRWENFHFVVNGRPMFLKGMNWMPVDFLLDVTDAEYQWALELVKNAGIQLLRVWSGGGMPEDDRFYSLCDRLGIMVMQDNFPANQTTGQWNRQVLASQVCQNLYRLRNHPSLALHTGGNEINPYAPDNDAAMWVISREIADLDPSRRFWRTSPDKGSAHIYRDMEPVWYRKSYGQLPFIGESGIHSFPNAKSLRQQLSAEEFQKPLSDIFTEKFKDTNPQLHNHFTEFLPARIPRMMARASIISDIRGISLPELCEATQMASFEFYQIMINAMRENYPINCGVMPWVFKRSWTTVAIQLVDGLGDPIAPYYAVKNAYAPLCATLALREVSYAPGETLTPDIRLLCDDTHDWRGLAVGYEIYSPTLQCVRRETFSCDITPEEYQKTFTGAPFTLPEDYTENFFLLRVYVQNSAGLIHQSVYWCKVLERLADDAFRREYRENPQNNLFFDKGPWLKPQLSALNTGACTLTLLEKTVRFDRNERRLRAKVRIENHGELPAFPVKLDAVNDKTLSYADDNYFFLPAEDSRVMEIEVRVKDPALSAVTLELTAWNIKTQSLCIPF